MDRIPAWVSDGLRRIQRGLSGALTLAPAEPKKEG